MRWPALRPTLGAAAFEDRAGGGHAELARNQLHRGRARTFRVQDGVDARLKLGPYEIVSLLGAGGMGEVYRAKDTRLGREVAIKVLLAERMADEKRRLRFVQEARAASALNHPNIVTIYEIEAAHGIDFIVMEYVLGKSLDWLIPRRTGMRVPDLLRIAIPMADATARAHARGNLTALLVARRPLADRCGPDCLRPRTARFTRLAEAQSALPSLDNGPIALNPGPNAATEGEGCRVLVDEGPRDACQEGSLLDAEPGGPRRSRQPGEGS